MSVDLRPRTHRQRRLGVLRNSQSPRARTAPPEPLKNKTCTAEKHREKVNPLDKTVKPLHAAEHLYMEKLRRLHQVRTENAMLKTRVQSSCDIQRANNVTYEVSSLRCATAPAYHTVRQFLQDKIVLPNEKDCDPVFDNKQRTHFKFKTRRRTRLATFPAINHDQTIRASLLYSPIEKAETVYLSKQPSESNANKSILRSTLVNQSASTLRRSVSAPAEVCRNSRWKGEILSKTNRSLARYSYSSLVKQDSKRPIRTAMLSHNSSPSNSSLERRVNECQPNEEPSLLGIIGEPCRSNKPPAFVRPSYKLPLRRPGLPNPIKIPQKVRLSSSEESSNAKNVCVIPQPTSTYPTCACRSVRFSCTDNMVHEYLTHDPVALSKNVGNQ